MSETQTIDNFSVNKTRMNIDGVDQALTVITFGTAEKKRTINIRDTFGPGDYLDALEIYGGTKSDEARNLAMIAFRVTSIDGVPPTPPRDRNDIHKRLNKIGNDGIDAIVRSMSDSAPKTEDQSLDLTGN